MFKQDLAFRDDRETVRSGPWGLKRLKRELELNPLTVARFVSIDFDKNRAAST